jgi:hypothetical protein
MARKKQLDFYFDHKTFKILKPNTEKVLRRLTLAPDSGMNEQLDMRDNDVPMVLCRRGTSKEIIGWALMDLRKNCQIYVHPKFRKEKDSSEKTFAENIVLELCSTYPIKGYYVHDFYSSRFWTNMCAKHNQINSLRKCIY